MNPEFEKRQNQVLKLLEILTIHAEKQGKLLVFIGGSAIQSTLKEPKRLSIDLDMFYTGIPDELIKIIPKDYIVTKKKSRDQDLFEFYEATKKEVLVKLDISRFHLLNEGIPFEQKEIIVNSKKTKVNIANPDYLLAAKLSTLAIGTIGRKLERDDFQINFLKDVLDANCLIDEFGINKTTFRYFKQVNDIQNKLRKTKFSLEETIQSAIKALLDSNEQTLTTITKGTLQNFSYQYVISKRISLRQPDYWKLSYRLAAYLNYFKTSNSLNNLKEIESKADKFSDRKFITEIENILLTKGILKKRIHELKILEPKALIYLSETLK